MTKVAVIALLKKKQQDKSLREFAKELGITAAYLSDIYHGRREPGPKPLKYLGLVKQIRSHVDYYPIDLRYQKRQK